MVTTALLVSLSVISVAVLTNLARRLFTSHGLPSNLPWVGAGSDNGPFGRAKANLASFFQLQSLLDEGYEKVSSQSSDPWYIY